MFKKLINNILNLPPDTGASIKTAPIFSASAAISFDTAGSIVLESMSREPFFTFLLIKVQLVYLNLR